MSSSELKLCQKTESCKQKAVAACDGCQKLYCHEHFHEHRRSLGQTVDSIAKEFNELRNRFGEKSKSIRVDSSFEEIMKWEKETLAMIQQRANELRQQVVQLQQMRIDSLTRKFDALFEQLEQSRKNNDFIEKDLENWKKELAKLNSKLNASSSIKLELNKDSLIEKSAFLNIKVDEEIFDRALDDTVKLSEEHGQVVSYNGNREYKDIRGKMRYEFGRNRIRIQIRHKSDRWIFLGINSASKPLEKESRRLPSVYGWCTDNNIYSAGNRNYNHSLFDRFRIRMEQNDVITLVFDCEMKKISMTNERTKVKHDLNVDLNKCPLPWQLHVILRDTQSRLRLLDFSE